MNWAMLTAIGQLATVFIGVPSVIYFAIQLREQNRERRQSAVNALTEQWGELTEGVARKPGIYDALSARCPVTFHESRCRVQAPLQRVSKPFLQELRGHVLTSRQEGILTTDSME